MTQREYKKIDTAIEKASESVVPFPISTENELIVAGDANATEINKHDFQIRFRVPSMENGEASYKTYTKDFKDVFITPRQNTMIVKTITALLPYFKKPLVDGDVVEYTLEEKLQIFESFGDDIYDLMYDLVAKVLKIDEDLKEYMMPGSVFSACAKIIEQYPELINESETFFV